MEENKLTAWERMELIRHKGRPTVRDYIPMIFDEFYEMHGDRLLALVRLRTATAVAWRSYASETLSLAEQERLFRRALSSCFSGQAVRARFLLRPLLGIEFPA